jgi:PAS domain S-box-containing protein
MPGPDPLKSHVLTPDGEPASQFFRAIVDEVAQPIFVKDRAFRFVVLNPAFGVLAGRETEDMIGSTDHDYFPKAQADFYREADERVFREGKLVAIDEEAFTDLQGRVHVLRTVKAPLRNPTTGEVTHLVGIITDVTMLKNAEAVLRSANEELERRVAERTQALRSTQDALLRKERLAVLGHLAGGLAHQIRNPLAAMATASSILKKKLQNLADADVQQALHVILDEVWEANRIITDLLDFARVKAPDRSTISAIEIVEMALVRARPPNDIEIVLGQLEDVNVSVDGRQARDAVANVMRNAFEAMPTGGTVHISIVSEANNALIAVEDTGPGLTRDVLACLFEPLVTSKALGLGLGLSTARMLIENQGGTVRASTQGQGGARFEICLPLSGSVPPAEPV